MSRYPTIFTFTTVLERSNGSVETEEEVSVTVRVESLAASAGFGGESCHLRDFRITDIMHDGLPLSELEIAELHERASNEIYKH
ncbi:MAG TPA: hypothetical protein VHS96_15965 [Bacteroidia bacterium]|nr:hypothetical protein [Bacteroidia bacterium]